MEKNFRKPLTFYEFTPDFQYESRFDLTKDRKIEIGGPLQCIEKNALTPLPTGRVFLKRKFLLKILKL